MKKQLRKGLLSDKKAVTIMKCFICNQIFYANNIFDFHMKQHRNKLEQKQQSKRKTLQGFNHLTETQKNNISNQRKSSNSSLRVKKQAINSNIPSTSKESHDDKLSQAEKVLQESRVLIQKITLLAQSGNTLEKVPTIIAKKQYQNIKKRYSQKQFMNKIKNTKQKLLLILETNFSDPQLQSYQQQLQYIDQVHYQLGNKKLQHIMNKVIESIQKKSIEGINKNMQEEYKDTKIQEQIIVQQYNQYVRYCSECFLEINWGELIIAQQGYTYHLQCHSPQYS